MDKKQKNHESGFSLVELIIVVAILAILTGILVPSFTGQIGKSKAATCATNRDNLRTEISGDYSDGAKEIDDGLLTSSWLKDNYDMTNLCPEDGIITARCDGGAITVSCSIHTDGTSFASQKTMSAIIDAMKAQLVSDGVNIDSGALGNDTSKAALANKLLTDAGVNLDAMGAKTWRYLKVTNSFYWTTLDINQYKTGDTVPVIKYSANNNTYAVYNAPVGSVSTYNTIGKTAFSENGMTRVPNSTSSSYEEALNILKKEIEKMS
ncbi:MAG: prepilin-type N-terminal cleavage/methylation domain-containing protein [Lachnospiraceae bacterium]|nr:prepilin-type N-terminal cleavage/methylation domain-containing protein [Lachnospiraceae bacterium]